MPTPATLMRARTSRWWSRTRRVLAAVLLLNVALGLALSVIQLQHQSDERSAVQLRLTQRMAVVNHAGAMVWESVARGRAASGLADLDLDAMARWTDEASVLGSGREDVALRSARSYADSLRVVRRALALDDDALARSSAEDALQVRTLLLDDLEHVSRRHAAAARRAGTVADVETLVLMLFAAGMGLLMFRRTVAARVQGDLRAARARARSEARFASLVQHSSDLITIVGGDGTITYQTSSVRRLLGHEPEALTGSAMLDLVHPEDRVQAVAAHTALLDGADSASSTLRLRTATGDWRYVESIHTDMRETEGIGGILVTSRDVSERIGLEQQLRHNAFHDALTGLANRALFTDRLEHALSRRHSAHPTTVVFLDLDDFKSANDTVGHQAGDRLLVEVAARLQASVREGDTVARFGGDEFAVLLEELDPADRGDLLERLQDALRGPVDVGSAVLTTSASLGIAEAVPGHGAAQVLAQADVAMYAAKSTGKDRVVTYEPSLGEAAERRLRLKAELGEALRRGQITAHFQPTVDLVTGRICGFEALARWEHPIRGLVPPIDFIGPAEQTGQIVEIGHTVLGQACAALARWRDGRPERAHLTMAVNLSARELEQPDLVVAVRRVLERTRLPADRLTLEVTESLLISDEQTSTRHLTELRSLGVRVAIDDFGTGYSSLGRLREMPVDIVKIDKSFVDRIEPGRPEVVVEAIARLTASLGMSTVAEGIEHSAQAEALRGMGCDIGQGFLFSRPVTDIEITALLAEQPAEEPTPDLPEITVVA